MGIMRQNKSRKDDCGRLSSSNRRTLIGLAVWAVFHVAILRPGVSAAVEPSVAQGGVVVLTDHGDYRSGEPVTVRLLNKTMKPINTHEGPEGIKALEKLGDAGAWEPFDANCRVPYCVFDIGPPRLVAPGEEIHYIWPGHVHENGTQVTRPPIPGIWRLAVYWRAVDQDGWNVARSAPFTINP